MFTIRFGKKKFRKRQVRKAVWILISTFAALAMVFATVAPAFMGRS